MDRCDYKPYQERDGSLTHCTRERGHREACFWPQLPEWRRRSMAQSNGRIVAVKEVR